MASKTLRLSIQTAPDLPALNPEDMPRLKPLLAAIQSAESAEQTVTSQIAGLQAEYDGLAATASAGLDTPALDIAAARLRREQLSAEMQRLEADILAPARQAVLDAHQALDHEWKPVEAGLISFTRMNDFTHPATCQMTVVDWLRGWRTLAYRVANWYSQAGIALTVDMPLVWPDKKEG